MSDLLIYGDIGVDWFGEGITAQWVYQQLSQLRDPVQVRINSPGGDVFEGVAIYNLLKDRGVQVIIDGLAASAASIIAMAGDTVTMNGGAMLMIHDPWTMAIGNAEEMRRTAAMLGEVGQSLVDIYERKTGLTRENITALMAEETWLTAAKAIEQHFADIESATNTPVMNLSRPWIRAEPPVEFTTGFAFRVAAHKRRLALHESGGRLYAPLADAARSHNTHRNRSQGG